MDILTLPKESGVSPSDVHTQFSEYLARTRNTICGRHPIGVLLGGLCEVADQGKSVTIQWVKYDHSSECETLEDSSVSYASAYIAF